MINCFVKIWWTLIWALCKMVIIVDHYGLKLNTFNEDIYTNFHCKPVGCLGERTWVDRQIPACHEFTLWTRYKHFYYYNFMVYRPNDKMATAQHLGPFSFPLDINDWLTTEAGVRAVWYVDKSQTPYKFCMKNLSSWYDVNYKHSQSATLTLYLTPLSEWEPKLGKIMHKI
jgi:hypothetical protein